MRNPRKGSSPREAIKVGRRQRNVRSFNCRIYIARPILRNLTPGYSNNMQHVGAMITLLENKFGARWISLRGILTLHNISTRLIQQIYSSLKQDFKHHLPLVLSFYLIYYANMKNEIKIKYTFLYYKLCQSYL